MRMVSEQCTVLVEKSQVAKFISDRVADGWQVQNTQDFVAPQGDTSEEKKREPELEVRLFRQHDINAPAVANGQK